MGPKAKAGRKAANGYKLPDPLPAGEIIKSVHAKKQWRLGKSIGVGGFGEIYRCSDEVSRPVGDDAPLAIKIEPHENGPLFVEMNFYIRAAKPDDVESFRKERRLPHLGMPVLRGSGSHVFKGDKYRFLVMDRYGKDLQSVFENGKKLFSSKAAFNLAVKIIDVLEYIHHKGYVHNDIKAQNLLLGFGRVQESLVYLVDFGLVCKYQRDGVHLEYKPDVRKAHDGTIEYTSRDAHIGAHARRSDLEILGYCLVHWMSGNLPWMNVLANPQAVQKQKNHFMQNIPAFLQASFGENAYPAELKDFLDYVVGLEFDTAPDYDLCRKIFNDGLHKRKLPADGKIDFSAPKSPTKKVGTPRNAKEEVVKRGKRSAAKLVVESSDEDGDQDIVMSEEEEEEEEVMPQPKKRGRVQASPRGRKNPVKRAPPKKKTPVVGRVVKTRDSSCQTSPAFVKMAKEAARVRKAAVANSKDNGDNEEIKEFARKAVKAAIKARARSSPRKTSSSPSSGSNPTPAMLEMMKKREEKEAMAAAKRKGKPRA